MEYNHLEYKIFKPVSGEDYMQTDLVVLYLLEGSMEVQCCGEWTRMNQEDILLINSGLEFFLDRSQNAICGMAIFPIELLAHVMEKKRLLLYADSTRDPLHSYQDLKEIFREMTTEYILHLHQTNAYMDSLLIRLLDCLIEHYQVTSGNLETQINETDERMQQMMHYIVTHIHDEVSLSDLANEMFVSTSTLSRTFKKNTGVYFADYVMELRVRMAVGLLQGSDQNLTQIAMNCGFSTSSAFNRSFKKIMGTMPSEYRKKYQEKALTEEAQKQLQAQLIREELREKGYQYNGKELREEVSLDLPQLPAMAYRAVWNECINVGNVYEMSLANTQFHVIYLQEQLHIRYVRLWNIFSVRMMISDGVTVGVYNFDFVNQVLDFLVQHRIRPFLDFGRRPDTAVRSEGDEVYYQEEYIHFRSRRVWEDLVASFLDEVVNRYGVEEVSTWMFELCRDQFHDLSETQEYDDPDYDFFQVWAFFYRSIREKVPGAIVGGISTAVENGIDYTRQFYERCVKENCSPDFASFLLYPYEAVEVTRKGLVGRALTVNMNLEAEKVRQMKALLEETGLGHCPLFITEWNNSISNRSYLNDSCFRAAYMCSKISQLWGQTDLMAVMSATDWISSFFDTNKILYGAIGLITKDLIHKPAFYALSFLRQMGPQFLARGEHFLLTRKAKGHLYLLCFYFSWIRHGSMQDSEECDLVKLRNIRYEEERVLNLQVQLKGMAQQGEYTVKKRLLNRHSGSVLDEWGKLGYEVRLNREDIKYLQSVSVPRIEMERVTTNADGCLQLDISLQPQEVALLHIYKGSERG